MMDEERIASYLRSIETGTDPFLRDLRRTAAKQQVPIVKPETEALLRFFVTLTRPARILELGTAVGYSGTVLLKAAPDATLVTVEKNGAWAAKAKAHFTAAGVRRRVTLIEQDAGEVLPGISGTFDLIFLDAAKAQYVLWLPDLLRLLAPGGVLIADNVFREGSVLESRYAIRRRDRTIHDRMRAFIQEIKTRPELTSMVLPLGDGVSVSMKKRNENDGSSEEKT